jgi:hypothetical protein
MADSVFNAEQFEQIVVDGENQTSFIPIPEADYSAYIESYEFKSVEVQGDTRVIAQIHWMIPDDDLAESLSLQEVKVRQDIWLDLTPDMQIDFGTNKNVQFGRLRQAVGLSKPGFQWPTLIGKQALISIAHTQSKQNPADVYSNVVKASPVEQAGV